MNVTLKTNQLRLWEKVTQLIQTKGPAATERGK
jgi:hypothetical protein